MGSDVGGERICLALAMCYSLKEKGVLRMAGKFIPIIFLKIWEWLELRKYANLHFLGRQVISY